MWLIPTLLILMLGAAPVRAQEPPACTAVQEGAVACLAGRLCACRFTRGGSMTGRPDRHAWDCGILRPACGAGLVPPTMPQGIGPQMLQPEILVQPGYPTFDPSGRPPGYKPERGGR